MTSDRRYVPHKVEPRHQQNQVDKEQPVLSKSYLTLSNEGTSEVPLRCLESLAVSERLCLWETETEQNNQHWRTCTEPE